MPSSHAAPAGVTAALKGSVLGNPGPGLMRCWAALTPAGQEAPGPRPGPHCTDPVA